MDKIEKKAYSKLKEISNDIIEMYENKDGWTDKAAYDQALDRQWTRRRLLEDLLNLPHA